MDEFTGIGEQLKVLDYEGVPATAESIAAGTYPLADGYYAVTRADLPKDHPAQAVVQWLCSKAGQQAVADRGFLPAFLEDLPAPDSEEAARQLVLDYYESSGMQVDELELKERDDRLITFTVSCSRDGQPQEPRTIVLEQRMREWFTISEGPLK